jgi:hypothetical protein
MNGSTDLCESNRKPLEMCPICNRKLFHNLKFNIIERYDKILEFCENARGKFLEWTDLYFDLIMSLEPIRQKMIQAIKELRSAEYVPNMELVGNSMEIKGFSQLTTLTKNGINVGHPIKLLTPRLIQMIEDSRSKTERSKPILWD